MYKKKFLYFGNPFVGGQQTHNASRQLFRFLPVVNLYTLGDDRPRMTIAKKLSWFKAKYDITRWDDNILLFRTISFWKPQYRCQVGADTYML